MTISHIFVSRPGLLQWQLHQWPQPPSLRRPSERCVRCVGRGEAALRFPLHALILGRWQLNHPKMAMEPEKNREFLMVYPGLSQENGS